MSVSEMTPDELLAAEVALGLLEGEQLLAARGRAGREPEFAEAVEWWQSRLAPLLDEFGGAVPGPGLWAQIERALDSESGDRGEAHGGEVIDLRRRLRYWQATAATAMAASVAALVFALLPMQRAPTAPLAPEFAPQAAPPLVASIPIADTPLRLAVTWLPDRRELLVSAAGLTPDGVHDHELWLIPGDGVPRSLGVINPGQAVRVAMEADTAALIRDGSRLALTREPLGGKLPAAEAGPVVAEGAFART